MDFIYILVGSEWRCLLDEADLSTLLWVWMKPPQVMNIETQQGASWAMRCPQMSLPWCWDSAVTNPPRFANNVDGGLPPYHHERYRQLPEFSVLQHKLRGYWGPARGIHRILAVMYWISIIRGEGPRAIDGWRRFCGTTSCA